MPVSLVQNGIWKLVAYPALILTGVCVMMLEQRESMSVASTTYARNESHFHGLARKNKSCEPILRNDTISPRSWIYIELSGPQDGTHGTLSTTLVCHQLGVWA